MIRNANNTDIPAIKKLMESEPGFWDESWRDNVIQIGIESADDLAFVWEVDGIIFGFISAHDMGFRAYLSELIVSPKKRGAGIGVSLIHEVEKNLIRKGCKIFVADVWKDAIGFYQYLGFSGPDVKRLRKKL